MFSISILIGSGQMRLLYKTEEAAGHAYAALLNVGTPVAIGQQELTDDFGQKLLVKPQSMHGFLFEDMDQSKLAAVELMLCQARAQNMATKQAQSDPAFRAGVATPTSPILSPMGNDRGF